MSDVNIVVLSGRLTGNPELRRTKSGTAVCDLRLASNRYSKRDEDGNTKQWPTYTFVTVWDKRAEWAAEKLRVGDAVLVQGRLVDNNYTLDDGTETKGRLKVDNARVQLLHKKVLAEESSEELEEVALD